jgi:hypothetical protein
MPARMVNVDEVLGNYAAATQHIRDLQQYAQWASGFQVLLMVADDALFFVRRSVTILAFDPICEWHAPRFCGLWPTE